MNREHAKNLLYQALETELGGKKIYEAAIRAAQNEDLQEEWAGYLDETKTHEKRLRSVFETLGLDVDACPPSRQLVRDKGEFLAGSIEKAIELLPAEGAELVAGETVAEAEQKDHLNWSLLSHIVENGPKEYADALREPVKETVTEEAHHLFHTTGWTRELWIQHLGFDAALPPPEEEKSVETRIGAGRAENQRSQYT